MNPTDRSLTCDQARELIHSVLDGDLMDASRRVALDVHLDGCSACREARAELETIQERLRGLPLTPLADAALDEQRRDLPGGVGRILERQLHVQNRYRVF